VSYVGHAPARAVIRDTEFYFDPKLTQSPPNVVKFDLLLTSYDIALADSAVLKKFAWQVLVVDEGHRLKNRKSKLFEALQPFRTSYRMLMTGTPLQNDLQELFNLFKFLQVPGFENPEKLYETEYASLAEQDVIRRLHDVLRPHMLRRLKVDVFKHMPEKSEYLVPVDLSPLQKQYYRVVLTRNYEFLRSASKNTRVQTKLLNTLSALQKVCNHPYLIPGAEPTGLTREEEQRRLVEASGKLTLVDKMLKRLKETGHRVLLFSQQTILLDILEDYIQFRGYQYSRIDGMTRGEERQERIDAFNKSESPLFLLLLSTRACRLGINLATADTVIIYDSDWNPHNDLQALSRAHRIG
jgi:SNF2 family DNA or RNA helicase